MTSFDIAFLCIQTPWDPNMSYAFRIRLLRAVNLCTKAELDKWARGASLNQIESMLRRRQAI